MNNKGLTGPLISVFIMIGALGAIIVFIYMWGLVGPHVSGTFNTITDTMVGVGQQTASGKTQDNFKNATQDTFVAVNPGFQNLQWLSYAILVFLLLGFLFLCFFVRAYPFLIIFWIGGMIVLIFASIFMSDAYLSIASGNLATIYESWGTNHWIMSHLPHIFTTIGFVGGFILFVIANRSAEAEGEAI